MSSGLNLKNKLEDMERKALVKAIRKYFDLEELVCDHTAARKDVNPWNLLDSRYLECLLVIRRDILKRPMYGNDRNHRQRGLRCNLCPLVHDSKKIYQTQHLFGKAGDFTVVGMSAETARQLIVANADLLPYKIRLEANVGWLHIDVMDMEEHDEKVYVFNG